MIIAFYAHILSSLNQASIINTYTPSLLLSLEIG